LSKTDVTQWDPTAGNNTDIAGINITEGCAAAGINDAIRTVMSQIATWLAASTGPLLKTGGAVTGAITGMLTGSTVQDGTGTARYVGYRNLPFTAPTSGRTLALTDVGMAIPATGTINIPLNSAVAFAIGDIVEVYNNSGSSISITASGGVTLRLGGSSSTGTRALAQRGGVGLLKVATDEWVALNGGIS
jgi:hypothetical protein